MLFSTFVIIIIARFVLFTYDLENLGIAISAIGIFGIIASVIVLAINYIGIDGYIARMNTRYETLVYQYENYIYDNDNDLGKRELMVDIQNWNEDLSSRKERQRDFWIGIYIPNIYDRFEYIKLKSKEKDGST